MAVYKMMLTIGIFVIFSRISVSIVFKEVKRSEYSINTDNIALVSTYGCDDYTLFVL